MSKENSYFRLDVLLKAGLVEMSEYFDGNQTAVIEFLISNGHNLFKDLKEDKPTDRDTERFLEELKLRLQNKKKVDNE
jgi:hypothetical protein